MHQNVSGLINKSDLLTVCLNDLAEIKQKIDVMCFTEHNMTENDVELLHISNFVLGSHFSRNKRRGGACILINDKIKFNVLKNVEKYSIPNVFECCGIELIDHNLIIICLYRVPKNNNRSFDIFFNNFDDILKMHTYNSNKKIVICGDFNIDLLKKCKYSSQFDQLCLNYGLKPSVRVPTRPKSGTCIDNILHNIRGAKCELHELGVSDHKAQVLNCPVRKTCLFNHWFIFKRDYSKENVKKFCDSINALSFSEVFQTDRAEKAFEEFYSLFKLFYDLCFPVIKIIVKVKNKPKWLSSGIKKCSKRKRSLLWKYRYTKNPNDREIFKSYSHRFNKIIKLTQKARNNHYILNSKNKSKATWDVLNDNKPNYPKENITQLMVDNKIIKDPKEIAECFNNYYIDHDLPQTSKNDLIKLSYISSNPRSIFLSPTDPNEVCTIIRNLKNTKCTGYDDICVLVLKHVCSKIAFILSYIINLCLEQGVFPSLLKTTIIKPLYKKEDKLNIKNYRPIALIPIFSKIFEKVLYKNLYSFFENNNLFINEQKGFRKCMSITLAIYEFLNLIYPRVDSRNPVFALYMDMTKAFDLVNHQLLLRKLEAYGVRGNCLELLRSYISNRTQITHISRICPKTKTETIYRSSPKTVTRGVPQGSVLGPLLFLIFINDISQCTNDKMVLYADDCTIVSNSYNTISDSLKSLIIWLERNNLVINIDKTKIMEFKQRANKNLNRIEHNGKFVEPTSTTKFLGLHIDDNLKWQTHIEFVCKKLSQSSYSLYLLSCKVGLSTLLASYHAFVATRLRYAIIFWGNATDWLKVFRCQKRCIRAMCKLKKTDTCKPYFIELKILTMPSLYIFELALFVRQNPNLFKIINRKRNRTLLCTVNPIQHKTALYSKSVFVMAPTIYNKIPNTIKDCNDLAIFKKKLFDYLIKNAFYSVNEYLESK